MQDQFREYLLLEAERQMVRPIIENKSRIIVAHATSGYKYVDNIQGTLFPRSRFFNCLGKKLDWYFW